MPKKDSEKMKVYKLIQREFDSLDRIVHPRKESAGDGGIAALPRVARDLYLVHDAVEMTCDKGIALWLGQHLDGAGWDEATIGAFERIGYPQVAEGIKRLLPVCAAKGESLDWRDGEAESGFIMDHEDEIRQALHEYLVREGYGFGEK